MYKKYIFTGLIALASIAVAFRVPEIKKIIYGES